VLRRGSLLGKYKLVRRIGAGGFSSVWAARDTVENRRVALKIALPSVVDKYGRKELEREARLWVRLSHPNVVSIRNADWIDGNFVLATELAERNLAHYTGAKRSGPIALRVVRDIAAGLAHAHSLRVMHRDVKPENIMIFADRRAALGDFGVSRVTRGITLSFSKVGTLGYMAPEQAYGQTRFSSDVFSLGLIAYELLTGFRPTYPFEWPFPRHRRFLDKVPEPLRPVLRKAVQFDPDRRYPDAIAFERALEAAFDRLERARKPPPRRRKPREVPSPETLQRELFRRRHGKRLELRYRCHRCDGPIAESMRSCPWCGSVENSFQEVTTYPLICPDCERGVRPEWSACPWCYRGRLHANGRVPRADPRAERSCSRKGCDGQLRPWMRYCPICKQKTRRVWTDDELGGRCPSCRWSVSAESWQFCPWCGKKLPAHRPGYARRGAGR
jgi:serine/threonine-protein kinase